MSQAPGNQVPGPTVHLLLGRVVDGIDDQALGQAAGLGRRCHSAPLRNCVRPAAGVVNARVANLGG